jgi:hypothetical protein
MSILRLIPAYPFRAFSISFRNAIFHFTCYPHPVKVGEMVYASLRVMNPTGIKYNCIDPKIHPLPHSTSRQLEIL